MSQSVPEYDFVALEAKEQAKWRADARYHHICFACGYPIK